MNYQRLFILPFLLPLFGFVEILSTKRDAFTPSNSAALKSYSIKVITKRFRQNGDPLTYANYMNDIRVSLKTKSISHIREYGVVQFIKGCKWESTWDGEKEEKFLSVSRDHFGAPAKFIHKNWQIDSDSHDPVYHSYQGERFALWRWNKNPADDTPQTSTYLHFKEPPHPSVFLTDLPGTSYKTISSSAIQRAKNSTLEFRTCLFHLTDLPETTDKDGSNIDSSKALKCFEWRDSFVFDFKSQTMKQPESIDPICTPE